MEDHIPEDLAFSRTRDVLEHLLVVVLNKFILKKVGEMFDGAGPYRVRHCENQNAGALEQLARVLETH